jgi:hypothetical protein
MTYSAGENLPTFAKLVLLGYLDPIFVGHGSFFRKLSTTYDSLFVPIHP